MESTRSVPRKWNLLHNPIGHVKNIPTMQFFTGNFRYTWSKLNSVSLTVCLGIPKQRLMGYLLTCPIMRIAALQSLIPWHYYSSYSQNQLNDVFCSVITMISDYLSDNDFGEFVNPCGNETMYFECIRKFNMVIIHWPAAWLLINCTKMIMKTVECQNNGSCPLLKKGTQHQIIT